MPDNSKTKNRKKTDGRISTLWALGVMLLVFAVAFSIAWSTRGPRIRDFNGIGQAEILKIRYVEQYSKYRDNFEFRIEVCITAGTETFLDVYKRSSRPKWQEGDIVPIVYNVNNSREYIIDQTPEEYAHWYRSIGIFALFLSVGTIYCFGNLFQLKHRIASESVEI